MLHWKPSRRFSAGVLSACVALLLAGCLLSPGKFTSTLDLRKGGTFSYRYDGEIHLLALSKLAEMGRATEASETFVEETCHDDETYDERPCAEEEVAQQRKAWEEGAAERKARKDEEAASMRAMLGGIDPADPAAAEELAARLRRQAGWNRVDYKGDGLFEVSFALSGKLDHDFLFPTMEGFPMSNFFVLVTRRDGGVVRIDAPGFAPQAGGNPLQSLMGGMMASAAAARPDGDGMGEALPRMPTPDGTFTIVTNGQILANNTDGGPVTASGAKTLTWTVNVRTRQAPTALVDLN
ncbi:hypothetical protein GCM10011515_06270 [Tsuneonella deserti]|uniref:Lipoprotein n=1 Tax=Tsuneonella deserti TaxID=2035528 RepID=A0ABQ1S4K7_9SPHN|nr:hypothetical protein [Tsuneonella deserti]GGD89324.1 hypothetical protein GCM10011515_06270 [Tsuneonella deserti]